MRFFQLLNMPLAHGASEPSPLLLLGKQPAAGGAASAGFVADGERVVVLMSGRVCAATWCVVIGELSA